MATSCSAAKSATGVTPPTAFLDDVALRAGADGYVAIVEVRGFHDWLLELLPPHGCREVLLVQADKKATTAAPRRGAWRTIGV